MVGEPVSAPPVRTLAAAEPNAWFGCTSAQISVDPDAALAFGSSPPGRLHVLCFVFHEASREVTEPAVEISGAVGLLRYSVVVLGGVVAQVV